MHVMSKGLEKSKKHQDSDLFEPKGTAEKLLEASKERDNLDSLLTQSRIEVATLTQKTHVLEGRLGVEREKSDQFQAKIDALQSHLDQEKHVLERRAKEEKLVLEQQIKDERFASEQQMKQQRHRLEQQITEQRTHLEQKITEERRTSR
jgi:hypothetical protein